MMASRREAGQENFRDRARQPRGAQRDVCFPPFSWPVRQCEHVCAAYHPPPQRTPCPSHCFIAVQIMVELPCGACSVSEA